MAKCSKCAESVRPTPPSRRLFGTVHCQSCDLKKWSTSRRLPIFPSNYLRNSDGGRSQDERFAAENEWRSSLNCRSKASYPHLALNYLGCLEPGSRVPTELRYPRAVYRRPHTARDVARGSSTLATALGGSMWGLSRPWNCMVRQFPQRYLTLYRVRTVVAIASGSQK